MQLQIIYITKLKSQSFRAMTSASTKELAAIEGKRLVEHAEIGRNGTGQ
jgi:hypothetical protein